MDTILALIGAFSIGGFVFLTIYHYMRTGHSIWYDPDGDWDIDEDQYYSYFNDGE